ncbi:hypothetical protein CRUP_038011 [Coryphaenoides rupestris]|nr:hypothetical protein CRUP_038011 [Coryphaenoides rupestris]
MEWGGARVLLPRSERQDEDPVGPRRTMAASRSSRVTRSSVGHNGLDENFCGRTLRNRSIAQPEETAASPVPRARSPKKKQEAVGSTTRQDGQHQQASPSQGKVADPKAPAAEGEQWGGSRKRSTPCLERDSCPPERPEACGRGKELPEEEEASPQLKKAKRSPSSEESSRGAEEEEEEEDDDDDDDDDRQQTVNAESPGSVFEDIQDNGGEGLDGLHGDGGGRTSPVLAEDIKRKADEGEGPPGDGRAGEDSDGTARPPNTHKASNGLGQAEEESDGPSVPVVGTKTTHTLPLLNGGQAGGPLPAELIVPCRNVMPVQPEAPGPPASCAAPTPESLTDDPVPELVVAEEQEVEEVEVDIVGEAMCPAQEEEVLVTEGESSTNGHPLEVAAVASSSSCCSSTANDINNSPMNNNSNSGETSPPPLAPTPSPTEPASSPAQPACSPTDPGCNPWAEVPAVSVEAGPGAGAGVSSGGREDIGPLKDNEAEGRKEVAAEGRVGEEEEVVEEEEEEEPDVYYFESDHLALKHNKDYQRLLQTIGVLEAQRTQAVLDLETLTRHQRCALADPISFVEQLQKRVNMGTPRPQRVVQLPDIAWDKYTSGLDALENGSQSQLIRGRMCNSNKTETFNQLWTVEEQKKLEQLLLKFPPEEVESKRWQKIADALGNRTTKQVASRVQKYFIKLTKAGIPVPGRTPNMCMYTKKVSNKRQHHLNKHLYRPSTFLTSYEPPEEEEEEGVPAELRHLPEYKELVELKRLKKRRLREIQEESSAVQHPGFKCDACGMEPIQGVRWHCQDCPQDNAVDFCSNCSDCLFKTETHKPEHHLEPVYQVDSFLDRDYCLSHAAGYNYLDPNYYPANR